MTENLMTAREQETAKRHAAIRADYARMRQQHPEASDWRVCCYLADRYKVSAQTIRNVTR